MIPVDKYFILITSLVSFPLFPINIYFNKKIIFRIAIHKPELPRMLRCNDEGAVLHVEEWQPRGGQSDKGDMAGLYPGLFKGRDCRRCRISATKSWCFTLKSRGPADVAG
jgi:hypothetical protein